MDIGDPIEKSNLSVSTVFILREIVSGLIPHHPGEVKDVSRNYVFFIDYF